MPGGSKITSGTTHAGERRSSIRTASAMSSGRIMSLAATLCLTKSVIGVSTNAGHSAHDLMPSPPSSLFMAWVKPTTAALVAE